MLRHMTIVECDYYVGCLLRASVMTLQCTVVLRERIISLAVPGNLAKQSLAAIFCICLVRHHQGLFSDVLKLLQKRNFEALGPGAGYFGFSVFATIVTILSGPKSFGHGDSCVWILSTSYSYRNICHRPRSKESSPCQLPDRRVGREGSMKAAGSNSAHVEGEQGHKHFQGHDCTAGNGCQLRHLLFFIWNQKNWWNFWCLVKSICVGRERFEVSVIVMKVRCWLYRCWYVLTLNPALGV